ncbi:dihydropteroate synthase [Acuticoccus kandeliae]|uniref:dihydropteroate synthase n=1 Tax=Acuticoccus kandeliae TaxID=2073160 RepID=UPI000D3E579A|nr:dihydropteroate synthase [Acuticoccus kandeliae]
MTKLVGILNITPDSFAEAAPRVAADAVLAHAERLIADGADVIDVGAESTRPNGVALSPEAEWERLAPTLDAIVRMAGSAGIPVSLDTRHAGTAARALDLGVDWINDVTGFADPAMRAVVARHTCPLVLMHSLTVPVDPKIKLPPGDPFPPILAFFRDRLDTLAREGIAAGRVILDPGLGFGPSPDQAIAIVARVGEFRALGCPILVGHSRKSFLTLFTDRPAPERDDVTLALSAFLFAANVDYLRVHDIARHKALRDRLSPLAPAAAS